VLVEGGKGRGEGGCRPEHPLCVVESVQCGFGWEVVLMCNCCWCGACFDVSQPDHLSRNSRLLLLLLPASLPPDHLKPPPTPTPLQVEGLHLPATNPFLPTDFTLRPAPPGPPEAGAPLLLEESRALRLLHWTELRFQQPKVGGWVGGVGHVACQPAGTPSPGLLPLRCQAFVFRPLL
jgi:hypothetical protein